MTGGNARWKWTQVADFAHPHHPEWDLIQWDLEDELVLGPRRISFPVNDPPDEWWYMKSKDAPGLQHLPAVYVLFKIVSEPSQDGPGVLEGWRAWWDEDLMEDLMARVRGVSS